MSRLCLTLLVTSLTTLEAFEMSFMNDGTLAAEEAAEFASCTWPLDPLALSSPFPKTKGYPLAQDTTVALALLAFLLLGSIVTYFDFLEFTENEEEGVSQVSCSAAGADAAKDSSLSSMSMGSLIVAMLAVGFAAGAQAGAAGHLQNGCLRLPLLASTLPINRLLALRPEAAAELGSLLANMQASVQMDCIATSMCIVAFALLGIPVMYSDVHEMAKDEKERSLQGSAQKLAQKKTSAREVKKDGLRYFSLHWRAVSCVVLLCSIVGSLAASFWEGTM